MDNIENNNSSNDNLSKYNREQFVYLISLSDKCGRHEDMINTFEQMIQKYPSEIYQKVKENS